jgi:hypothetical protein
VSSEKSSRSVLLPFGRDPEAFTGISAAIGFRLAGVLIPWLLVSLAFGIVFVAEDTFFQPSLPSSSGTFPLLSRNELHPAQGSHAPSFFQGNFRSFHSTTVQV